MVEFVVGHLERVRWISGHCFVDGDGYHLDWSPEGSHRMMLLQIALKAGDGITLNPSYTGSEEPGVRDAVRDFWQACVAQLALEGEADALPAFIKIIVSWRPRSDQIRSDRIGRSGAPPRIFVRLDSFALAACPHLRKFRSEQ